METPLVRALVFLLAFTLTAFARVFARHEARGGGRMSRRPGDEPRGSAVPRRVLLEVFDAISVHPYRQGAPESVTDLTCFFPSC